MSKLNSEFNYRYQVQGETVWAKIQTLNGFLKGRIRAAKLEQVGKLKYQAKIEELKHLKEIGGLRHVMLRLEAEILEDESFHEEAVENFAQCQEEIEMIKRLLAELYDSAEPTRIKGYTDEQMYEVNAANEFTAVVAKEIQAEIIATGHPSPAKLHNAMSNPHTFNALKSIGLIPQDTQLLGVSNDPLCIEFK
jgi:hypothetical protein